MPEHPPVVLVVGGLDPSGGAGLAADLRACASAGVLARPVASCLTVQSSLGVERVEPVDVSLVESSIEAALGDGVDAVKVGLVSDATLARAIAKALPSDVPIVIDPVLRSTSGQSLASMESVQALLPHATLLTPNAAEARALTGEDDLAAAALALRKAGARHVLVKGGDEPTPTLVRDLLLGDRATAPRIIEGPRVLAGLVRGTGCTLASLAACHLAQGYALEDAVMASITETRGALSLAVPQRGASVLPPLPRSLLADARGEPAEARARMAAVAAAWRALMPLLDRRLVPEVGANLSFLPHEGDPTRAAALSARCVRSGRGFVIAGPVETGGIHHTARVAAAAFGADGRTRAAMNLRHRDDFIAAARAAGLVVASFSRADQPAHAPSSVEWGTGDAIMRAGGRVPDVIFDLGGPGKEPMLRILAADPEGILRLARRVLRPE